MASTGLLGADDVHALADRVGLRPTKRLGQNFMIDPSTVRRIVRLSGVKGGGPVLEVGPGLGSLTLGLLEAGANVTAVEIDPTLTQLLPKTVRRFQPKAVGNFHVLCANALNLREEALPALAVKPFQLVSNLPYNVATPVLLTLLTRFPTLSRATALVQKEVAGRLTAKPGSKIYGVPSVKLAWFGACRKAGAVSRSVFWPVPNVDSTLITFQRRDTARPERLRTTTFSLIDRAFGQRRKTLRASLRPFASADQIRQAGIDPRTRGERLSVDDFERLARVASGVVQ